MGRISPGQAQLPLQPPFSSLPLPLHCGNRSLKRADMTRRRSCRSQLMIDPGAGFSLPAPKFPVLQPPSPQRPHFFLGNRGCALGKELCSTDAVADANGQGFRVLAQAAGARTAGYCCNGGARRATCSTPPGSMIARAEDGDSAPPLTRQDRSGLQKPAGWHQASRTACLSPNRGAC